MKLIVSMAVLITAVALAAPSAAFAAKKHKKTVSRTSPTTTTVRAGSRSDPYAVYVSGEYIGRDPDPNIRASMIRNPHIWDSAD